jgi:hypothetical protein
VSAFMFFVFELIFNVFLIYLNTLENLLILGIAKDINFFLKNPLNLKRILLTDIKISETLNIQKHYKM